MKPFPLGNSPILALELSLGAAGVGAKVEVVGAGVATSVGTGSIPKSAATFAGGQVIFVHARPALKHLHSLQALDPVSFPDHPLGTPSPSLRVQVIFFPISLRIGVKIGSVGTDATVGVGVTDDNVTVDPELHAASTKTSKVSKTSSPVCFWSGRIKIESIAPSA